jgi:hypothetical protein
MWTSTALNVSKNTGFPTCVKLGQDPHVDLHCFDSNLIGIKSKKGFFFIRFYELNLSCLKAGGFSRSLEALKDPSKPIKSVSK